MMPNFQKKYATTTTAPSLEAEPSRKLTAAYGYSENAKFSIYTDQKTETETDVSASLYRGSESEFNIFCNLDDEWCDDDEDADEQVIPRIISASVVKTKEPVGLTLSCNNDARYTSSSAVVSSISPQSPFHPDNYSHGEAIREGDEILTINGHRVKDARRAAEMIRATDEGVLTVVASTAAPASGHRSDEGRKSGVRRRIDGTAYHMIRLSNYVTEGGSTVSMSLYTYRGMTLEVIDQTSSFVSIKSMEPSSVFARSGLKTGDILLTVDGSVVRTVDEAIRALSGDQGIDGIGRVVVLLVFSVWDMRTRVIRDELSGTSPNDWDISLSCEEKLGHDEGERECITLTMSDTTVSFQLMFDQDGTCSCPEPLAALNSFPQHQKLDTSEDSSLRSESESIFSKTETRAALELLFHRHIQRVVDALNYHCWRQARLITRAIDAFGGNRIDQIPVRSAFLPARDSCQKNFPVAFSLSAATTSSTRSLTSSCPSVNYPKSKSLLILSDLERAMASQPQVPTFSLYNIRESLSREKSVASQQVLHGATNLSRGLMPHSLSQLAPSKLQPNVSSEVEKPLQDPRAQDHSTMANVQNKSPRKIVMRVKRPKFIPPLDTDDSSDSSSSDDDSDDSSSAESSPRRRSQRKAPIKKNEVAPACNQIISSNCQQPPLTQRKNNQLLRHQRPEPKASAFSAPSLEIQKGQIQAIYKVSAKVVGLGAFGAVRYCTHRETRKEFAVKSIPKNTDAKYAALLQNEISILQRVRHKNIIQLVDLMQDDKYIHIVMEKCQGGDLFDKVIKDGVVFGEKMVSQIIASILDAVDYLHERNICHRDLKAEHIMLKTSDKKRSIKIIDFGLAVVHNPEDPPLTAFAGSAFTVAPEVIQRRYGKEADLWSIGVIAYFLLTRLMPFNANSNGEIFKKIQSGIFAYPKWAKTGVSEEAKDFIDRLLVVNPKKRMTAKQALSHAWIRKFHHINKSTVDMFLAVVPFESNKVISCPRSQDTCEGRRHSSEPARALVSYADKEVRHRSAKVVSQTKLLDPSGIQFVCKTQSRQPPGRDKIRKSSRRLHVGESREDKDRNRSIRDAVRKRHHKLESKHRHHSSGDAHDGIRQTLEPPIHKSRIKH